MATKTKKIQPKPENTVTKEKPSKVCRALEVGHRSCKCPDCDERNAPKWLKKP